MRLNRNQIEKHLESEEVYPLNKPKNTNRAWENLIRELDFGAKRDLLIDGKIREVIVIDKGFNLLIVKEVKTRDYRIVNNFSFVGQKSKSATGILCVLEDLIKEEDRQGYNICEILSELSLKSEEEWNQV